MTKSTEITKIKSEVDVELTNQENVQILAQTTFKGLDQNTMRRAMIEGRMRGFTFKDFLEKNVYAIPFKGNYSLVTSIDFARKVGMRSGICGKDAPQYTEADGKIETCTVTVYKNINGHIGPFSQTVYFDEYSTGNNLWKSKPRTMIAKVAEMHALRMACPEEMSQFYSEEEKDLEIIDVDVAIDYEKYETKLREVESLDELKRVWSALPIEAKTELESVKEEMKAQLSPTPETPQEEPQEASEGLSTEDIIESMGSEEEKKTLARQKMEEGMKNAKK